MDLGGGAVMCRPSSTIAQRTSPIKILGGLLPNLTGMILIWPSLIIVQMVMVHCIAMSHRLNIDF